ncbi:hypothetical protein Plhal710r2_c069g0177041 [Plasmopara halstedii]
MMFEVMKPCRITIYCNKVKTIAVFIRAFTDKAITIGIIFMCMIFEVRKPCSTIFYCF